MKKAGISKNILLLNPFHGGSHGQWAEGLIGYSEHNFTILTLPDRNWKWRMHGAAIQFSKQLLDQDLNPDIILTTDMLDVSTLKALICNKLPAVKIYSYFHENQITYPWSPTDQDVELKRDYHYAFINYVSALASDKVFFNSEFHLNSFLQGVQTILGHFPDRIDLSTVNDIKEKSFVLGLGMELSAITNENRATKHEKNAIPVLLWNHRWEYDKNPELFFNTLFRLHDEGSDFHLIVTGESHHKKPPIFKLAEEKLNSKIIHFGYAASKQEYHNLLKRSDILPVTSKQDFFGGSIVEAICGGALPLLPDRLAYPEHIPKPYQTDLLYQDEDMFYDKLKGLIKNFHQFGDIQKNLVEHISKYDWQRIIGQYDKQLREA